VRCAEPVIILRDDPKDPGVMVDGHDVSERIREPRVADVVSQVAAVPAVRARLVQAQRGLVEAARAGGYGVVMEGRDIGTVVLPDADLKVFLTADVAARAARRAREDAERLGSGSVATAQANLESRDQLDSTRAVSPLQQASDAQVIDGTWMSLDEVIDAVIAALPGPA
jgi:cytidylate kinase